MNRSTIVEMNFENLSEEDLYSDEDELNNYGDGMPDSRGGNLPSAADRRAHHNALERKRRDHIKDSFSSLRDAVPTLKGDKVKASRAQILKKAADYIGNLKQRNVSCETDIEEILKQNKILLEKVRNIETRAQANGIPLPPGLSEESVASAPLPSTVKSTITTKSAMTKGRTVGASSNGTSVITSGSGSVTLKVEPSNSTSSSGGGSGGTSVISGGSGIVKLEHSNGKATNANKIILLNNSSWRTTNEGGRNTMVIPTSSNSRLVPTIKNGASKIIVQNPQHIIKREITDDSGTSSSTPQHVIHLSGSVTNNGLGNATPIIISSNSLTGTTSQYVIKNGAVHPTGGAYRTLMVQQTNSSNGSSGTGTAGTVSGGSGANSSTPSSQSIHIVSSFGGNVNGQFSKVRRLEVAPISIEKKMKISSDQARIVVPNIKTNGAAASGSNPS